MYVRKAELSQISERLLLYRTSVSGLCVDRNKNDRAYVARVRADLRIFYHYLSLYVNKF